MCGQLKCLIYATSIESEEELIADLWLLLVKCAICLVYSTAFANPSFAAVLHTLVLSVTLFSNFYNYYSLNLLL